MNIPSANNSILENYLDSIIYLNHHIYTLPPLMSSNSTSSFTLYKCLNQFTLLIKDIPPLSKQYKSFQYLCIEGKKSNNPNSRSTYYSLIEGCFEDVSFQEELKDIINLYYNFIVGSSITSNTLDLTLNSKNFTKQDILFKYVQKTLPSGNFSPINPLFTLPSPKHRGYSFLDIEKKMLPMEWEDIYNCALHTRYEKEKERAIMQYCSTHLKSKLDLTISGAIVKLLPTIIDTLPTGNIILSSLPILYSILQPFLEEYFSSDNSITRKVHDRFLSITSHSPAFSS